MYITSKVSILTIDFPEKKHKVKGFFKSSNPISTKKGAKSSYKTLCPLVK